MIRLFDAGQFRTKGRLEDLIPLLAEAGITGLNATPEIMGSCELARSATAALNRYGLRWCMMATPVELLAGRLVDDETFCGALKTLDAWAGLAREVGVTGCFSPVFPGSDHLRPAENFRWHIERVSRIYEVLHRRGLGYALEFIGPQTLRNSFSHPFVDSLSGVLAIADAVDPEIGFVFDTFHWYCSGGHPGDLAYALVHQNRMACLHINDGTPGKSREQQQDLIRAMPMTTGVVDSLTPYRRFLENQYKGPVLIEALSPTRDRFDRMGDDQIIREVADSYDRMDRLSRIPDAI